MARSARPPTAPPPESFTATVVVGRAEFTFTLYHRPLTLGPSGTVQYYWMDGSQFRNIDSDAAAENFRNCVGHWAAAMRAGGWGDDLDQQVHYVTALCYPLIGRSKALQDVYLDAHLDPRRDDQSPESLPDATRLRIRDIVEARDRDAVGRELDQVFGRFEPPAKVLPALQEAFRRWAGRGVELLRRDGNDGLERFLEEADGWLARYRKKGGHVWVRHFINLFSYEAKVSFYRCYANAWVDLIPWLKEHRGLDDLSERFLRVWHNQNQPIEVPPGRTAGGLYLPTHGRATVLELGRDGTPTRRSLTWPTGPVGPSHVRDVFNGQVLSLHPLSGFFMKDLALCAIAGQYFMSEAAANARGRIAKGPGYWRFVGAILSAAHLYRLAWDRQNQGRGVRCHNRDMTERAASTPRPVNEADVMEGFAAAQQARCPDCGKELRYVAYHPGGPEDERFDTEFACPSCRRSVSLTFDRAAFEAWLMPVPD